MRWRDCGARRLRPDGSAVQVGEPSPSVGQPGRGTTCAIRPSGSAASSSRLPAGWSGILHGESGEHVHGQAAEVPCALMLE